ncbi:MAG: type II secretion system protein, partial [Acidimicrobiales bacterium]
AFMKLHRTKADDAQEEEGFTLIELLIVVLILGILAAIVAFAVGAFTSQSAVAACNTDAKTVESAIAAFEATNSGTIPATTGVLTTSASGGPYLHSFPKNTGYYFVSMNGSGNVLVKLKTDDPADKIDGYTTTGVTTPTGYDNFTWPAKAGSKIAGLNVCAGA